MQYRRLIKNDIEKIWSIDRSEYIKSVYVLKNNILEEKVINYEMDSWNKEEALKYNEILLNCFDRGGFFLGSFVNDKLVGVIVVDNKFIGSNNDQIQMKFLHIDKSYRGKGIGKKLFKYGIEYAKTLGAKKLYISSIENTQTVKFYMHLGCRLTNDINEELLKLEPNDIHMEYLIK